jgi:hypothetical protein
MNPTFVLGEHSFVTLPDQQDPTAATSQLVDLIETAQQQGQVMAWSEIFYVPVNGFENLSDFLFGPESSLDRDVRLRLGTLLDRLKRWGDADGSPPDELTDGSTTIELAPSVGLAHSGVVDHPWAVVCAQGGPFSGKATIWPPHESTNTAQVWFLDRVGSLRNFWRDTLNQYRASRADVQDAAEFAFPGTTFATDVWQQTSRFEGGWADIRPQLLAVLSGLDDGAVKVFSETVQSHERIARMSAEHGATCSPESPNTHGNAAAMRRRRAEFGSMEKTCEWHAKLDPHRNRVHFIVEDSRLFVGIFHVHLPV